MLERLQRIEILAEQISRQQGQPGSPGGPSWGTLPVLALPPADPPSPSAHPPAHPPADDPSHPGQVTGPAGGLNGNSGRGANSRVGAQGGLGPSGEEGSGAGVGSQGLGLGSEGFDGAEASRGGMELVGSLAPYGENGRSKAGGVASSRATASQVRFLLNASHLVCILLIACQVVSARCIAGICRSGCHGFVTLDSRETIGINYAWTIDLEPACLKHTKLNSVT